MTRIALLLLLPFTVCAQEALKDEPVTVKEMTPREEVDRATRLLAIAYASEQVKTQCLRTPNERLDVAINGFTIPVQCSTWNRWYRAEQERLAQERLEQEASAATP